MGREQTGGYELHACKDHIVLSQVCSQISCLRPVTFVSGSPPILLLCNTHTWRHRLEMIYPALNQHPYILHSKLESCQFKDVQQKSAPGYKRQNNWKSNVSLIRTSSMPHASLPLKQGRSVRVSLNRRQCENQKLQSVCSYWLWHYETATASKKPKRQWKKHSYCQLMKPLTIQRSCFLSLNKESTLASGKMQPSLLRKLGSEKPRCGECHPAVDSYCNISPYYDATAAKHLSVCAALFS